MYWKYLESKADTRARLLADRHYSRQHPGSLNFCPPGNNIVLLGMKDDALWVSHRCDPSAQLLKPRADGFDCWDNPYFRNESNGKASDMIREAVAITMFFWGDLIPLDGMHSFVDPRKVKPIYRRGSAVYGWVFEKAGFSLYSEPTKERGLLRYVMTVQQLRTICPVEPRREQLRLFV